MPNKTLKIALIGPIDSPVTKDSLGGTESWTYAYAEELVKRGFDVTLFAPKRSECSAKIITTCDSADIYNSKTKLLSPAKYYHYYNEAIVKVLKSQSEFDLIHVSVSSAIIALPILELFDKPVVFTLHSNFKDLPNSDLQKILIRAKKPRFVYLSKSFSEDRPTPPLFSIINNGIKVEDFSVSTEVSDYFLWMSRISPEKGVEDAISFAKKTGAKLMIAGPARDQVYFGEAVEPNLSSNIKYIGPLDFGHKKEYLSRAKALIFPLKTDEPFPLIPIEALASGCPVTTYDRGPMGEIIENGKNGFLVENDSVDAIVEAVSKIESIDRNYCRKTAEDNFSIDAMVEKYLELYTKIMERDEKKD